MGLPIWKDPDEERLRKEAGATDPTAAARSPIRRRASVHGRNTRTRLPRDPTLAPPRFERSSLPAAGITALRSPRRGSPRGVPPVSTLLESADRRSAVPPPPPPPRVEAPNDYGLPVVPIPEDRERSLRGSVARLQHRAARLDRQYRDDAIRAGLVRPTLEERLRISSPPEDGADEDDGHLSAPRTRFITRENTPFHRSPEPMSSADRAHIREEPAPRRSNLPTPPLDQSEEPDSLFVPEQTESRRSQRTRSPHPLSNSWRPESPIDGLGDRDRSPTPADGWEIMQSTIAPDAALPSADSSFTSAAASQSFTTNETSITEPDRAPPQRRRVPFGADNDSDSETSSMYEVDGVSRDLEEREATARYAEDMYYHEVRSEDGLNRILRHREAHADEGNKFALANESVEIEIGFRLIDEALNSEEGLRRVFDISQHRPQEARSFEDWIFSSRREGRRGGEQSANDEAPCPHPERYGTSEDAAREANAQVHHYFRRITADSLGASGGTVDPRRRSPPPQYEPPTSNIDTDILVSRDPPEPHPVSPPSTRSERDVGDLLLSGDEQDLNAVRRVVERLAQRDDVPDEWWMSMGLNLSRTRVRSRSPAGSRRSNVSRTRSPAGARVRGGRVERGSGSRRD